MLLQFSNMFKTYISKHLYAISSNVITDCFDRKWLKTYLNDAYLCSVMINLVCSSVKKITTECSCHMSRLVL